MKMMQIRKKIGMTQAELAEKCQTTQQTIAKIEKGVVDPKISTLQKIADALNCELQELFYTRKEFIAQLNAVAQKHHLNLKKIGVMGLNDVCLEDQFIPPYHPFWEEVVVSENRVKYKEEKQ